MVVWLFELFDEFGADTDIDEGGEDGGDGGGPPEKMHEIEPARKDGGDLRGNQDRGHHSQLQGGGGLSGKDGDDADFAGEEMKNQKAEEDEDVFSDNEDDDGGGQDKALDAGVARGQEQAGGGDEQFIRGWVEERAEFC